MDPLIALLIVVMSVLTVLLVIVGVQVVLILKEARESLSHLNRSLRSVDNLLGNVSQSVQHLENSISGMKVGTKLVEAFATWVKDHAPSSSST